MRNATDLLMSRIVFALRWLIGRFSLDSLVMYMLALASEIPVMLVRGILVYFTASIVLAIEGDSLTAVGTWTELTMLPVYFSMFALLAPFGTGWLFKARAGGREPSDREKLAYQDAIDLLQSHSPTPLPLPGSWFVIDTLEPNAAVCGNTLMICRGLLESEYLPAVLAHELGHLGSPDGRLAEALNRLIIWQPRMQEAREAQTRQQERTREPVRLAFHPFSIAMLMLNAIWWLFIRAIPFSNGGFGLRLTRGLWGAYWREREYDADRYAAKLGQAEDLAEFLEHHALIHDHPVPFIWFTEHTHPPTELRIDKLRKQAEQQQDNKQEHTAYCLTTGSYPLIP